mgnify:CR=1 FL=1
MHPTRSRLKTSSPRSRSTSTTTTGEIFPVGAALICVMRRFLCLAAVCVFILVPALGDPPAAISEELQSTERTLAELQSLKAEVQSLQSRLDALIAALSERRGQLQTTKPAAFGGVVPVSNAADRPDAKPPTVRCAALTKDGTRCTRAAMPGQRYCKQHALARQK